MDTKAFLTELSRLRPNTTFLTLNGYRNDHSEVANYSIAFHISYESALKKSIETLAALELKEPIEVQARFELLNSFAKSLSNMDSTPMEELDEQVYTHIKDDDGNYIKGVKIHNNTGTLHLYGLVIHKRVLMPGIYLTKNQKPLTVVKDKLRYLTRVGKFRQFKILPDQVDSISVENLSLLPPE